MKAVVYEQFQQPLKLQTVPDPTPEPDGVVIRVRANGLCRSDWHGWMGHDPDITLPHVPGHELAGEITAVGRDVRNWQVGRRVTVPFSCGCGRCDQCTAGHQQICDNYYQPGFTGWGSFAEYVPIRYADTNLVAIPDDVSDVAAASLGCRFATAFRAVVAQGKLTAGQTIAVHGCGGVGLSVVMIAHALGAEVVAVDINDDTLNFARRLGATHTLNGREIDDIPAAVQALTGGVHVSVDALGHPQTCRDSILSLRKRGKHIQVGLLLGEHAAPSLPMAPVIGKELEIIGSHGIQAFAYADIWRLVRTGRLPLEKLVNRTISLAESVEALPAMGDFQGVGVTVIDRFE